ncbi:Na+/H+ antiporter NhaA [Streptomyces umbrinus]
MSSLAGIGFTVSLLIGELAFDGDQALTDAGSPGPLEKNTPSGSTA